MIVDSNDTGDAVAGDAACGNDSHLVARSIEPRSIHAAKLNDEHVAAQMAARAPASA